MPAGDRPAVPWLLAAVACAFAIRPIDDADVWYHLAAGRLMWTTWRWPTANVFAFTTPDHPWVDVHWLFQLLLYGMYALGGVDGCIALTAILVVATVAVLYADARRFAPRTLAVSLTAVALTIASPRLVPRPEVLAFVLLAFCLWLLDDYPRCGRAIYAVVALQLVWTNAHGTVPIGPALVACYWLGAGLAFLPLPRGWRAASGCTPQEWRRLTIVLVLTVAACFASPWGVEGARLPLELLRSVTGGSVLSARIGEFRPPLQSGYATPLIDAWVGLLVVTGLSFLVAARRWHLGRLLAAAAFGILSTRALRNMALFVWIAVPVVAANLGPLIADRKVDGRVARAGVVVALVVLLGMIVTNRFSRLLAVDYEFGRGVNRASFSPDAMEFLRRADIGGRPFNCFYIGGFLAWNVFPGGRVFVDGRTQAYPESFYRDYFRLQDDPSGWAIASTRWDLDYAILYHAYGNRLPLARYLTRGHGWTLVYYDDVTSIFLPVDEKHRAVRERAEQTFAEILRSRRVAAEPGGWLRVPIIETARLRSHGDFLLALGASARAIEVFRATVAIAPDDADLRTSLGTAYWDTGDRAQAVEAWRETLRRTPGYAPAARSLADAATAGVH